MGGGTGVFQGQQLPRPLPQIPACGRVSGGAGQQYSASRFSAFHVWSSLQPQSLDFPPRAIMLAGAEVQ